MTETIRTALPPFVFRELFGSTVVDRCPTPGEIAGVEQRLMLRESDDHTGWPEDAIGFVQWITRIVAEIPEDQRATATISFHTDDGDRSVEIERGVPETDEQWAARKADILRRKELFERRDEEADRAEFERLKGKFDKQP